MTEVHSSTLKEYIENSTSLENLDISWNQLSHLGYLIVLKACMEYGGLISLNLSHNSLIQGDNTKLSNEVNAVPLVNTLPKLQKQTTKKG